MSSIMRPVRKNTSVQPVATAATAAPTAAPVEEQTSVTIDGQKIVIPPGSAVEYISTEKVKDQSKSNSDVEKAEGTGAGVKTSSDKVTENVNGSAPSTKLAGGTRSTGGDLQFSATLFDGSDGHGILFVLGFLTRINTIMIAVFFACSVTTMLVQTGKWEVEDLVVYAAAILFIFFGAGTKKLFTKTD